MRGSARRRIIMRMGVITIRDEKRIEKFMSELEKYWKLVPDWRFGQLMSNVLGTCERDPFFYEEDEMLDVFEKFFKKDK